ncbi:MAG: PAS domain S-box protein, partial [Burkholderiales bacterium]
MLSDGAASEEELLRFLAERTSDVSWTADENWTLTYVAPQVTRLLGHSPEELVGESVETIVHESDAADAASLRDTILASSSSC